jgi:hypothetical protein
MTYDPTLAAEIGREREDAIFEAVRGALKALSDLPIADKLGGGRGVAQGCALSMLCVVARAETNTHGGFPSPL